MRRLEGKVAFVTGAGAGIGRATALRFAKEGAKVVIAELNAEWGGECLDAIRGAGGDALLLPTDVTDDNSVAQAVRQTVQNYGTLDIVHNCAGGSVAEDAPVTELDLAVWDRTQALDLKGLFLVCRHSLPELVKAGGGSVINMSSLVALRGAFRTHAYAAAKGGIISLTRSLAAEYARNGIRVNAICPGIVLTARINQRLAEGATNRGAPRVTIDWKDYPFAVGQPDDIANVALFLASDESRMITGAIIAADGGASAY